MKQFLDETQTAYLQARGIGTPKSVCKLTLDMDMDTVPIFSYSIGDLLDLLPEKIYDEDEDATASLQITSEWEVFYTGWDVSYKGCTDIFYYKMDAELIEALYRMVIELKDKGLI